MAPNLKSTQFSTKVCVSINDNFSENELLGKDRASSFLAYGGAGKRVLEFPAYFSARFSKCSP